MEAHSAHWNEGGNSMIWITVIAELIQRIKSGSIDGKQTKTEKDYKEQRF